MSYFNANDGTSLHEMVWSPIAAPIGSVVIVHGFGEHISRYQEVAETLAAADWAVRGADLRGHGESGGSRGFCNRFSEYLEDLHLLVSRARQATPNLPVFLLGHSFGGLVATHYALAHQRALAGLLLSSPFYGLKLAVPAVKVMLANVMTNIYPRLALPTGLQGRDVSRDPQMAESYDQDPLNLKKATVRWFTETRDAQEQLHQHAAELSLPCLLMHGAADPIADPATSEALFARFGSDDKTLKMLPEQLHEIFNELPVDRQKTLAQLTAWVNAHRYAQERSDDAAPQSRP